MGRPEAIPALTSIRGLAAWWVVLYHFNEMIPEWIPDILLAFIRQGYLAVDLFFILSGFILGLNYGERFRNGLAGTAEFYWHRVARIYPLHLAMLMLFLLNPLALSLFSTSRDIADFPPDYFLMSLLLVQNWGFTTQLAWNVPAWSISTEVFAYILFPLAALAIGRWVRSTGTVIVGMLAVMVILALAAGMVGGSLGDDIPRFGLTRCCLEFLLGMLVWRLRALVGFATAPASAVALLAAAVLCLAYATLPLRDALVMPAAWTLLVLGLADRGTGLARLMEARWLELLGLVSYATYLSHFFIRSWVKFLLLRPGVPEEVALLAYLILVAIASILFYRWVELPGRFWLRNLAPSGQRQRRPVGR